MAKVGKWTFVAGLVLALLAGLGLQMSWVLGVLAVLGLVVGFLNVTGAETRGFLLAAIGLMLSATAVQSIPFVGEILTRILANLIAFIAAAVLVVSLKALFETTKD
jgi:ATP synthase protein I